MPLRPQACHFLSVQRGAAERTKLPRSLKDERGLMDLDPARLGYPYRTEER
jgi:hypothetical protein